MQHHENFSSIDLIIGPMYAGKTTELIRRLITLKSTGLNEIADEFQEWFYANFEIGTDLMDEDMAKLREHFKRFK